MLKKWKETIYKDLKETMRTMTPNKQYQSGYRIFKKMDWKKNVGVAKYSNRTEKKNAGRAQRQIWADKLILLINDLKRRQLKLSCLRKREKQWRKINRI